MNSPSKLFRQVSVGARRTSVACVVTPKLARSKAAVVNKVRCFSAQPEKAVCYEDLVKGTLKKMVTERCSENAMKAIADEDLERRFQHYDVS
jgi:hypothetical protein